MVGDVQDAFIARLRLVDDAPGFLGWQVMHPCDNEAEIWLVTHWTDEVSYRSWHKSPRYHDSHQAIPKGLRLVPKSAEIKFFHQFAE
jgi:heme oxygenase (mycobilin-producing)